MDMWVVSTSWLLWILLLWTLTSLWTLVSNSFGRVPRSGIARSHLELQVSLTEEPQPASEMRMDVGLSYHCGLKGMTAQLFALVHPWAALAKSTPMWRPRPALIDVARLHPAPFVPITSLVPLKQLLLIWPVVKRPSSPPPHFTQFTQVTARPPLEENLQSLGRGDTFPHGSSHCRMALKWKFHFCESNSVL